MTFLVAILRAALLLAIAPVIAYSAADLILPRGVIEVPVLGLIGFRHAAFLIAFAAGFFFFAMSPTGAALGPEDDFSEELGPDGEGRRGPE